MWREGIREGPDRKELVLPMPRPSTEEPRSHGGLQEKKKEKAGLAWEEAWDQVFCRSDGRPLGERADRAGRKNVLRVAGVRDGRRTAGTPPAMSGVDPRSIPQVPVHARMSRTTHDIRATDGLTRGAVNRRGGALWS